MSELGTDTVAISLPVELIAALDRIVTRTGESRSAVIRELLLSKHLLGHVIQRGDSDCEVAVAATLAGMSYDAALPLQPPWTRKDGLTVKEMTRYLAVATGMPWACRKCDSSTFGADLDRPGKSACLLRSPEGNYHWIAVVDGVAHDPEFTNGSLLPVYPRADWTECYRLTVRP